MPFVTPEQVRTAIDNADLAIHGAIQDGTLLEVMVALKGDIVSSSFLLSVHLLTTTNQAEIFQAKKSEEFAAEFKQRRYLFLCCKDYMLAQRAGTLDEKFLETQETGLKNFLEKAKERKGKAKAKDTMGGVTGPAPTKASERRPEAGPSRIRVTSPLPMDREKSVPQVKGPEATLPTGAGPSGSSTSGWAGPSQTARAGPSQTARAGPSTTGPGRSKAVGAAGPAPATAVAMPSVPPRESRTSFDTVRPPGGWSSKFYAAMGNTAKAARMHGPPTDEMAKLSVGERQEKTREGASRPHRRLASLEEDVDEEYRPQPSKRKRLEEMVDSDGEEEKEDDDEEVEERSTKRPRVRGSQRRVVLGTGEFYNPRCELCQEKGWKCEKQSKKNWACCRCAVKKVGCKRGGGEKRRNARRSDQEDESDGPATSDGEGPAPHGTAVPRTGHDRKGKGKGE